MNHQYANQRLLNQQGHDLQMDMWNKTNYGAQVQHMKDAGLNPALMYGSAGQGGSTGSQSGGSASGGNAAGERVMDLNNALVGAEIRLKNAQANKENSATDFNEIKTIFEQMNMQWLKDRDMSSYSNGAVRGLKELTGKNYGEIFNALDNRIGEIIQTYKDPGKAIKDKAKIIKGVLDEAVKGHGILFDNLTKGIKKGYDNWKNNKKKDK
jgi:hypothetical protein